MKKVAILYMSEDIKVRLIKKYPNRRLYDTKNSVYITLNEVKEMILQHENLKVIDLKSQEDLTRSILLQIIFEEESLGMPLFSSDLLMQLIRFYGHAMQGMMGKFLESNFKSFIDLQTVLQDRATAMCGDDKSNQANFFSQFINFQGPVWQTMANAYLEQSQAVFQQMQSNIKTQAEKMLSTNKVNSYDNSTKVKNNPKI